VIFVVVFLHALSSNILILLVHNVPRMSAINVSIPKLSIDPPYAVFTVATHLLEFA